VRRGSKANTHLNQGICPCILHLIYQTKSRYLLDKYENHSHVNGGSFPIVNLCLPMCVRETYATRVGTEPTSELITGSSMDMASRITQPTLSPVKSMHATLFATEIHVHFHACTSKAHSRTYTDLDALQDCGWQNNTLWDCQHESMHKHGA
jgi:hypothetical protein